MSDSQRRRLRCRLLVAEDCPDSRAAACAVLARGGYEVTSAADGAEALDRGLRDNFQLFLLDVQMPLLDGLTVARRLRSAGQRMPVLAMSGDDRPELAALCREAGCETLLVKPWSAQQLLATVAIHLDREFQRPMEGEFDAALQPIAQEFLATLRATLNALLDLEARRDRSAQSNLVHQITGAAGMFGFSRLTQLGRHFEEALRLERPEREVASALHELTELMQAMTQESASEASAVPGLPGCAAG